MEGSGEVLSKTGACFLSGLTMQFQDVKCMFETVSDRRGPHSSNSSMSWMSSSGVGLKESPQAIHR